MEESSDRIAFDSWASRYRQSVKHRISTMWNSAHGHRRWCAGRGDGGARDRRHALGVSGASLVASRNGVGWRRASEFREPITTLAIGIAALVIWIARTNRGIPGFARAHFDLMHGGGCRARTGREVEARGAATTGLAPRGRVPGSL